MAKRRRVATAARVGSGDVASRQGIIGGPDLGRGSLMPPDYLRGGWRMQTKHSDAARIVAGGWGRNTAIG